MNYYADRWVILKITDSLYKVLAGFSGSYTAADTWRLNSGITEVKKVGKKYEISGNTGSTYWCHEDNYGFTSLSSSIYESIISRFPDIELLDETYDFTTIKDTGV